MNSHLADLSQMTSADLALLKQVWLNIEADRRRQIVSRLSELAKDNVELNFNLIFKYCLRDPDVKVKSQAIEGLVENEDPALIRTFIGLLERDPSEEVQAAVAVSLGKFSLLVELEDIDPHYRETLSQTLLAITGDKHRSVEVRRRALEAVAPLNLPSVREAIRKAYESRDERLVVSAVYSMGKTCDDIWLVILYKELHNPDSEIRYEAAGACGEIGNEDSVPHLVEIIHDPDIEVRLAVIQSLGEIGGIEARKALQRIANDESEAIRDAVNEALIQMQNEEDITLFRMQSPKGQYDKGQAG